MNRRQGSPAETAVQEPLEHQSRKKVPYSRPVLRAYGSVTRLTKGGQGSAADGGPNMTFGGMGPPG